MIHEILHFIGFCGDSSAHIDLIDIFISLNDNQLKTYVEFMVKRLLNHF